MPRDFKNERSMRCALCGTAGGKASAVWWAVRHGWRQGKRGVVGVGVGWLLAGGRCWSWLVRLARGRHDHCMNWRDRIEADPNVLVGKAVIKGKRISVELVIDLLARGYTREQVLQQYPSLAIADVQACLAYAAEVLRSERMLGLLA